MRSLLFASSWTVWSYVTTNLPTTRDIIGNLSPQDLETAKVFGIFTSMIYIIFIVILIPVLGFAWGLIVTRGKLMDRIERWFIRTTDIELHKEETQK